MSGLVNTGQGLANNEQSSELDGRAASSNRRRVPRRRMSTAKKILMWALMTLVVWGGVAAVQLNKAKGEAEAGEAALRSVADNQDPTEMDLDSVALALSEGGEELRSADERLNSWLLKPLGPTPFVGRQFKSVKALVGSASAIVTDLEPIVARVREIKADPASVNRVDFLTEMSRELNDLDRVLQSLDLGPQDNLVGTLADARSEFVVQVDDLSQRSAEYSVMLGGLSNFLSEGDYLLLGTNNAEMRVGSGMHLSIGRLHTSDGGFQLDGLQPARDLVPVVGAELVDPDVDRNWGFVDPSSDFRKLGYSGRFDEFVAPQALEMWSHLRNEDLDGVILLDPFVLEALLGVIGPVEVEGEMVTSERVLNFLLEEQYAELGFEAEVEDNEARGNRLSLLAVAAAQSFENADWDPLDLIRALKPVAEGRHLMVFSQDEIEQAAWRQLGVDGAMSGDEIGVFWLNTGASKLDPFLDVRVEVSTEELAELLHLTVTVDTTSRALAGMPSYILGPWESLGVSESGAYRGRLSLYLPGNARDIVFSGNEVVEVLGIDGPSVIVATGSVEIRPGSTVSNTLSFTLPLSTESVVVMPSTRYPVEQWNWNGTTFDDSIAYTLDLG